MGVLNVTPDSFSDGGRFPGASAAVETGLEMVRQGADLLDVGGESTRPGSATVDAEEQIRRVEPVIRMLRNRSDVAISIDTRNETVAAAAIDAGAAIINDISAGRDDPGMLRLAARRHVAIVLMHMQGTPQTMQQRPEYADVVEDVAQFLRERTVMAMDAGVLIERVLLDPGIGFGKTTAHNLALLRDLKVLTGLGRPVLVGTSRKRFIGEVLGEPDPKRRILGTAATVTWSLANGAAVVRVHDVREMAQVAKMTTAILGQKPSV